MKVESCASQLRHGDSMQKVMMHSTAGTNRHSMLPVAAVLDFVLTVTSVATGIGAIYGILNMSDMGLINRASLTVSLSIAAPAVTMVGYVAPISTVIDAVRMANVQNLPTPVFQSQAACNILALSYGIQIANSAVLASNLFGLACQIMFLAGDHYVRFSNGQWFRFCAQFSLIFNVGLYICAALTPINILGHMITLFNIVLFAVPLAKLGNILRTRNASTMPAAMAVIAVTNNAVWTLYSLLIQDIILLLPSLFGYVLSAFQVLVVLWCNRLLPFDLGFLLLACPQRGDRDREKGTPASLGDIEAVPLTKDKMPG